MRICPYCRGTVSLIAIRCRFCARELDHPRAAALPLPVGLSATKLGIAIGGAFLALVGTVGLIAAPKASQPVPTAAFSAPSDSSSEFAPSYRRRGPVPAPPYADPSQLPYTASTPAPRLSTQPLARQRE